MTVVVVIGGWRWFHLVLTVVMLIKGDVWLVNNRSSIAIKGDNWSNSHGVRDDPMEG